MPACILTSLTPVPPANIGAGRLPARSRRTAVPIWAVLLAALQVSLAGAVSERVSFRTDDGLTITATWFESSSRPAPAVIFVHMLQKSRRDWDQVAAQMAAEGIGGLAIDLRGHGDSAGSPQDYSGMVQDVRAARRFLTSRPEVIPSRIGIAGASIGASLAALASADDPAIVSLALLSPSLEYRGLRIDQAIRKYGTRPALLVAGDDDGYAVRTARDLAKAGGGVREVLVLPRAGHGTAMLAGDPDLGHRLLEWFRRTLL